MALVAARPSPQAPAIPFPATVEIVPSAATLLILLLLLSLGLIVAISSGAVIGSQHRRGKTEAERKGRNRSACREFHWTCPSSCF